ncbi:hypothetical protein [Streptomyces bacillaris]|uniref:hypothetical protein n=1 Tax=Streptomyces bacillaris TaxID=68179 RepID=UPI0036FD4EDB
MTHLPFVHPAGPPAKLRPTARCRSRTAMHSATTTASGYTTSGTAHSADRSTPSASSRWRHTPREPI